MARNILRRFGIGTLLSVLIVFCVLSSGCFDSETKTSEKPILRIGLIPAEDQIDMLKKFDPVNKYLETELGMEIETFTATDYSSVIEAMRSDKIDVAFFGPFSYVLAVEQAGAEAIVTGGTKTGEVATYKSCIITHPDSGINSIDDLKNNASEITFSFVDPASTSGNLIPRGYLLSIGIDPDTDFKTCMFAGGHAASGLAVKSKNVDAGAMYDIGYSRLIDSGAITPEEVIIIWKSDPIPKSPVAVRNDLDPELKKKIQQAFVDMPQKDPEAMKTFESKWEKNELYVAIDDSTYEYVRGIGRSLGYI
ncbi:MAG: phosphonate ABC transporter substrate-binding protein [Methanosarcinaceae archaeon]